MTSKGNKKNVKKRLVSFLHQVLNFYIDSMNDTKNVHDHESKNSNS